MTTFIPAPTYVLALAAWVPTLVIWHADGRFTRLEGEPCVRGAPGGGLRGEGHSGVGHSLTRERGEE